LHLSDLGHEIVVVDNLSRRSIEKELKAESLTPISSIEKRIKAWKEVSGKQLYFENIDIAEDYEGLLSIFKKYNPDAIVHFAEQRAAPYSMKNSTTKRYTVRNNTLGTTNLLFAIVELELDVHFVHLGTMGVYGYGQTGRAIIPQGYLKVEVKGPEGKKEIEIVYPPKAGSVYHNTKVTDHDWFQFVQRNDELRITDLHQGVVWGTQTPQTMKDERLINRFDYDGDYGTVLNRFLVEAAIGYGLTVHGTGGQKRAFIHIKDTVRCVEIALNNPPKKGERVMIFNQATETHRIIDLAKKISKISGVDIAPIANPRKEALTNELEVDNKAFLDLGLNPTTLDVGLMEEIEEIAKKYKSRIDKTKIPPNSYWTKEREEAVKKAK